MGNKEYEEFFEKIEEFKEKQNKQKQRGLNNYNILTTVLKESDEVKLHSKIIYSLLDTNGEHYQSNLFLDKFLEVLNIENFKFNTENCSVYREYKNIDLYITDGNKHIIIENKIYAKDQKEQIKRYIEEIEKNKELSEKDILVIYLSLDGKNPTSYSLGDLKIKNNFIERKFDKIAIYKSISYKDELLKWLKKSQYEVQNITNLNEVFNQYIDVVKMVTNQYKEKVVSLSDYLVENESVYKMAVKVHSELPKARKKIIDNFFQEVINLLEIKLGEEWIVEIEGNLSKSWNFPFRIYKKEWRGENNLIFGFEFDANNYYKEYFGIVKKSDKVDIENDIVIKFKERLVKLDIELKTSNWWLHDEWFLYGDFVEYALQQNSKQEFIDRMMKIINIFELDSNLITDINKYIQKSKVKK